MRSGGFDASILRQDLQLVDMPDTGGHTLLITDPIRYRFFRVARDLFDNPENGDSLKEFAAKNELLSSNTTGSGRRLAGQAKAARQGFFTRALHGYLYFRIPLAQPEPFLKIAWPLVRLLATRTFVVMTLLAAFCGLYLASRKSDELAASAQAAFSWGGLLPFAIAFGVIKIMHELGHAFMAWRHKIPVPSAGIAVMLFTPVLYTETSAAWRLAKKPRLLIGAAGMMVELAIAAWALLLWAFVEDGPLRAILFSAATTGWVMTLAVNLSPFMRFDGYFLLSDLVGIANLQDRSFALARWFIRELLLDCGEPKPEPWDKTHTAGLILFAFATWIYRLTLYFGIALLVYHFTVKLIGIFLFAVEIWWFILLPFWREGKLWWSNRATWLTSRRAAKTGAVLACVLLLTLLPLDRRVTLPAILVSAQEADIHATADARIRASYLRDGLEVKAGQTLLELELPDMLERKAEAAARLNLARANLARAATDPQMRSSRQIIEEEERRAAKELESLEIIGQSAVISAPFDGTVVNLEPDLQKGRWIGPRTRLAIVTQSNAAKVVSFADDMAMARIKPGVEAVFVPDERTHARIEVRLQQIAAGSTRELPVAELADIHGGTLATTAGPDGKPLPLRQQTRLDLVPHLPREAPQTAMRGVLFLEAEAQSLASGIFRRAAKILIEEASF